MTGDRHPHMNFHDVIILGAGAAGLMCAAVAGQRGRRVLLLEQARHPGEKIRISGGGRCNFTNLHTSPAEFSLRQSAVLQIGAERLHPARLHRAGRELWHRLAREDARAIVLRRLVAADRRHAAGRVPQSPCAICVWAGASPRFRSPKTALSLSPIRANFAADPLVVATGGPSIPKMGSSGLGYKIARAIRPQDRDAAAGAGALDVRYRIACAIQGSVGGLGGCRRELRQDRFRRGPAFHASRA